MENTTRLHPDDMKALAELIADKIAEQKAKPEPLLNLKELAGVIGVPYNTLNKKKLPFKRIGTDGRKRYIASEVLKALRTK